MKSARKLRIVPLLATCLVASTPLAAQDVAVGRALSLDSLLSIPVSAAARYGQTTREAAASTSVVTREEIERYGFRSLSDVIATLAGFYITSDLVAEYMGVRGFGRPSDTNNRILLLVDGRRWNSIVNSEAGLGMGFKVPLEHVERVEVVRGPGSALYGSSAMFAVVNVVTRSPDGGGGVVVEGQTGSRGFYEGATSAVGTTGGGFAYSVFAGLRDTEGPDHYFPELDRPGVGDGWVLGQDYYQSRSAGFTVGRDGATLTVFADDSEKGDPTAPYGSLVGGDAWRTGGRHLVDVRLARDLSPRLGIDVRAGYERSRSGGFVPYADPAPDYEIELLGNRWSGEAQVRIDPSPANRLVIGTEVQRTDPSMSLNIAGHPVQLGELTYLVSGYVQDAWQAHEDLSLVLGVRADRYSSAGSALSPRGAVVFHASGSTTVKALYGEAFRAPTPLEQTLFDETGIHQNPGIGAERIRTAELVVEQRLSPGLHATVTAFDYRMRDLIVQVVDGVGANLSYRNLDRVTGRGVDLGINGHFKNGLSLFGNASFQNSEKPATRQRLPNSPGTLMRVGASAPLVGGFRIASTVRHDGERTSLRGVSTGAYTLVDVSIISGKMGSMEASLSVANLLDTSYRHPTGLEHRQVAMAQAGRTLRLSVSAHF